MSRELKLGLPIALLLAGSMWFYVDTVYLGHQLAEAAIHDNPQGIFSDFYPRWLGTRELLLHHRNPYSSEVTRDIQIGYYGRPLDPQRPGDPKDQMAFAYPLYVVFLIAPTTIVPFSIVRLAVHWFFILLTALSVPLWLRALRWKATSVAVAMLTILMLGNLPVVQGIKLEQLTLLVGGMIAVCVFFLVNGWLLLAGMVLAFATIKPHLILLMATWLLMWACNNYRERRGFIWGFGVTLATLCLGAEFLMPGWGGQFLKAIAAYREYTGRPVSLLAVFTTPTWGFFLSALLLLMLAGVCWRVRRVPADDPIFGIVTSLVLATTITVIPMTSLYNQILLLPAVLLLARHRALLWRVDRLTRLVCVVVGLLVVWPWLAALSLSIASLFVRADLVQKAWAAPLWTSMTIPLGVLLLLARLAMHVAPGVRNQSTAASLPIRLSNP